MDIRRVFLLPSELYIAKEPTLISTILGSCVGVVLYNRHQQFGGMNHFMLARSKGEEPTSTKHGDYAMETLLALMLKEDAHHEHLEATILGGGNVGGHLSLGKGIGADNIAVAREILMKHGIKVVHKNIGGDFGRKVHFESWTGEIEVIRVEKSTATKALEAKTASLKTRKIKVLIVDDSPTIRSILEAAISDDPKIEVIGAASDAYEARELILEHNPDVICLDIIMPMMDGLTFLKKLFLYKPKPVIIISTVVQKGSKLREEAKEIGAFDVIDKADLNLYQGLDTIKSILISKIKAASMTWIPKKKLTGVGKG